MFKYDRKIIVTSILAIMLGTVSATASEAKKDALDGGMTYTRANGMYSDYRINEQMLMNNLNHGRTPTANELKAWDTDIMPDGTGLPDGEGSVEDGDELYEEQCAVCHGDFGAGGVGYPTLAGGEISSLTNQRTSPGMDAPKRTIGTYWPKASTLIWYIRDSMPYAHPKSLTNNELYALTAYLLSANEITIDDEEIDDEFVLSRENFADIEMPNKDGFYPNIDGKDGVENMRKFFADGKNYGAVGVRCMTNCEDDGAKVMRIGIEMKDVKPPYSTIRSLPKVKANKQAHQGEAPYEKSCAVCHKTDMMGAPAVGDKEAWDTVMEKGIDQVNHNAIYGIAGMPPKGGNMALSEEDMKQIVDFMITSSK